MSATAETTSSHRALERLRTATRRQHQELEEKLDAVARLSDLASREDLARRFAAFYRSSHSALASHLSDVQGLDFAGRSAARLCFTWAPSAPPPARLVPNNTPEALGMFYVVEGSSLGGRTIQRTLRDRGIDDPSLRFLDPYGREAGARWRQLLAVLARELGGSEAMIAQACLGAVRGFAHADRILCGDCA